MDKNQQLLLASRKFKKTADKMLADSDLVKILSRFGKVSFHGSYVLDLMLNGDIDMYVVGKSFTKNDVIKILTTIAKSTTLSAYSLADHKTFTHKRGIFPNAYYIGLQNRIKGEKWKIDIWFLTPPELRRIKKGLVDTGNITKQQRLTILQFKDWRNKHNPKISGHYIYQAVLENNISSLTGFRKFIKTNYPKIWQKGLEQS